MIFLNGPLVIIYISHLANKYNIINVNKKPTSLHNKLIISLINCRFLQSNWPVIHTYIEDFHPDFLDLTETWSPSKSIIAHLTNNKYNYKTLDRSVGIGCGVLI